MLYFLLQILFERVSFNTADLQEAVRIIDKDVPRTNRDLSYYQWVILSTMIDVCGDGVEIKTFLDESLGDSDLAHVLLKHVSAEVKVQAICWCWETSSSRLLLLIQVKNETKLISDVFVLITLNSLTILIWSTNLFLIQRWAMLRAWMTCAVASWRFLTLRWTLSGVSPATWKDSTKISWLMVCIEK